MTEFISVVLGLFTFPALVALYCWYITRDTSKKPSKSSTCEEIVLSWPAQEIMKAYNNLPAENRPVEDMLSIVQALDVKYGGARLVDAAYERPYDGHTWNDEFSEYTDLIVEITNIKFALEIQKKKMEVAGVQDKLDMIPAAMERLRAERGIINDVTKELM